MPTPMTTAPAIWLVPAPVDDAAAVDDGDDAADAELGDARVPLDLDELGAEAVGGVVAGIGVGAEAAAVPSPLAWPTLAVLEDLLEGTPRTRADLSRGRGLRSSCERRAVFAFERRALEVGGEARTS